MNTKETTYSLNEAVNEFWRKRRSDVNTDRHGPEILSAWYGLTLELERAAHAEKQAGGKAP